jgi:hypothetical protein
MSSYAAFELVIDNDDGTFTPVPSVAVKVYDVTDADPETGAGAIALADTASDSSGTVPGASVAVAAGRRLRFSYQRAADGLAGFAEQVTT